MAFKINENCISCGICASDCPVSCIASGGETYVINADECIDCGVCAGACPADAVETA